MNDSQLRPFSRTSERSIFSSEWRHTCRLHDKHGSPHSVCVAIPPRSRAIIQKIIDTVCGTGLSRKAQHAAVECKQYLMQRNEQ